MKQTRFPGARILLVDNDEDVAVVVRGFLSRLGYDVLYAADGQSGLARLAEDPDLMILDLRMPGMGGVEVLAHLDREDDAPPVLVLSGYVDAEDRARLEESPLVHAIVGKPFDLFELAGAAERAIEGRRGGSVQADGNPSLPGLDAAGD